MGLRLLCTRRQWPAAREAGLSHRVEHSTLQKSRILNQHRPSTPTRPWIASATNYALLVLYVVVRGWNGVDSVGLRAAVILPCDVFFYGSHFRSVVP